MACLEFMEKIKESKNAKRIFPDQPTDFYLTGEDILDTYRRYQKRKNAEDYKEGDSALFFGYKQIFRPAKYLLGDSLFGFTEIGKDSISVRGDLKGEAYRRVKNHEMAHQLYDMSEDDIRSMTGTHMKDFMKLCYN